ncbi:MAG: type I glyceraldehyde-3-phosphate dehydrogenase [Anaeromicrobium sp.]|jgi:glyceraldehyde 3-phosphate dehydrogenase|uniref:type I glyceraldehyde-3-phosphate dehydrogenase n=1 Tax=Anaeromicrobium sp. TaxID=1929132 RepID=UPI0025FA28CD|nr:type I glyceraldehyde-3-phosphate dehydrogenase [Anaeromicrobium sp.]MCT4593521.1 type I glyceraldehyde-3-phosphate dehydrogenase [Anaeromicrobium sp.]
MTVKVAINGFGRIGRNAFKIAMERADKKFEVVAINDLTDAKTLAHLLKYDSCFGKFDLSVEVKEGAMVVDGKEIKIFAERDPENLPWGELGIDVVVESTGFFREKSKAEKHIKAGAKKVIISAPAKNEDVTVVLGVNEGDYNPETDHVISNASCTTNCLAPFAKIIDENFGIKTGLMTTVHAYTNDQNTLDAPHADLRRARAAAESIIPTTTGAAAAVALVLPQLKGKLNGMAMRVPTPTVSVVDLVVELEKETTAEEINSKLKAAAEGQLKGILGFSDEPLVSIDYRKDSRSSIVDGLSTMVMEGKLAKIVSWYDNEWGYSTRVVDLISYLIERGL